MSKAQLVISVVVVEGRTHAQVAVDFGVSRSWVTRLVARWRLEGDAAFEPCQRSTSPCPPSDATRREDRRRNRTGMSSVSAAP